jgi:hypothetical protein
MPILGIYASSMQPALNASSYDSIATVTVGVGGSSSISFTSIPSTYKHLQIRTFVLQSAADNFYMQLNSDTAANYSWHQLTGDGASAGAYGTVGASNMLVGNVNSAATSYGSGAVIDIFEYANTNTYKTVRSLLGSDANGSGLVALRSGNWRSTSAVSSITIGASSGSFKQYSSFALYGCK